MDSASHTLGGGEGKKSFRGKLWQGPGYGSLSLIEQYQQTRQIDAIERFCNPTIRDTMPDPLGLNQVQSLADAVLNAKKVGIFGDYDADGITSSVMWKKFLDEIGIDSCVYIPSRADGYGASEIGIQYLMSHNVDLMLFLDCGSASKELLESITVKVCVLDHHQVTTSPEITAIVNPHLVEYPHEQIYKSLCTAGLSFLVLARLARMTSKIEFCLSLLDLSAIGTIGDMMEMNDFNRACIKKGLALINSGSNLGLNMLIEELKLQRPITASQLAFYIIPCLNAAGRVSKADTSLRFLLSQDPDECIMLAKTLKSLNERRKEIEEEMVQEAILSVDQSHEVIVLKNESWHPGIVGIVASRVKEMYGKTAFVLYKSEQMWKGSARSHLCNVGLLIQKSVSAGLAIQGGGHYAAGGVTVCATKVDEWVRWMRDNSGVQQDLIETVEADCTLSEGQFGQIGQLKCMGPFGNGNPAPKLILKDVWLKEVYCNKNYVRCKLTSGLTIFGFRFSTEFLTLLLAAEGKYVDLLLSVDESGSAKLEDARLATE